MRVDCQGATLTRSHSPWQSPREPAVRLPLCLLAVSAIVIGSACAVRTPPTPSPPPRQALAEVTVDVGREWTDTGVVVQKGDRLVFWATGEIHAVSRPDEPAGPDGIGPSAFRVGRGDSSAGSEMPSRSTLARART